MDWFQTTFIPHLQNLGMAGYWLLALVTFGESFFITGMFVPGTVLLVIMGGLVTQDYYDFKDLALFAVFGSILGDGLSYEIGRFGQLHVERYSFLTRYLKQGRQYFQKHGGKSVIMGRFIGPIRPMIPFIAGVSGMPRMSFYVYNLFAAVGWSISYILLGYVFGVAWKSALRWSSAAVALMVAIAVIVYVVLWYRRRDDAPKVSL